MVSNSIICKLLQDLKEQGVADWKEWFAEHYPTIVIKQENDDSPLHIFNYSIGANFRDRIVQEARGIIINTDTLEVVCYPFRKFGKYYESYADKIDWSTAKVQEKLDGSIIKMWCDKRTNKWRFSTNGMIDANEAQVNETLTYQELIESAVNFVDISSLIDEYYNDTTIKSINPDMTYIFELCSRKNQVVIHYEQTILYHIGTRHNITGQEYDEDIGIVKPATYDLHSLGSSIYAANDLNPTINGRISDCTKEGFVVVDGNYNRIKVKSQIYSIMHNIVSASEMNKSLVVQYLYMDRLDIESLCAQFPDDAHILKYYDYRLSEFLYNANKIIEIARKTDERCNGDRKEVALVIKDSRYSAFGFYAVGNDKTLHEIMNAMTGGWVRVLEKYIPKYIND